MNKILPAVILSLLIVLTVIGNGCIGGKEKEVQTTTLEITKTVTHTLVSTSSITQTKTISTFYITTLFSTKFETVTIPITTTIVISGTNTSTVVNSNGSETTIIKFEALYTYSNVPFMVYSINNTTKIVTIPQTLSPLIDPVLSLIKESIENKYTSYTDLANYIKDFNTLRLKIIAGNFTQETGQIMFSDMYYSRKYNSIYGALYYAGFALNYHTPVTLILAVKNNTIVDAFMGFDNKYYSQNKIMYYDALKYSWFKKLNTYTILILVLDENGIVTRLDDETVTNIPQNFSPFESLARDKNYGFEILITSKQIIEKRSYFVQLDNGNATVWNDVGDLHETTFYHYAGNILTATTIKPTQLEKVTTTITLVNTYFTPAYYMGVDILGFFPCGTVDYNARVISGIILYTIYTVSNNTMTVYEFTISKTQIINATYYEVAIGNNTIATGSIAGWVN